VDEFEVKHEVEGRYDILVPHGELDIATHIVLREQSAQLLEDGRIHQVVDLTETTFIDSTALGSMIDIRARALDADGSFAVIVRDPRIVKLFELTRLTDILAVCATRDTWRAAAGMAKDPHSTE
jgi:anti-sigma B factor antagonist